MRRTSRLELTIVLVSLMCCSVAHAQVSITALSTPVLESFDSLASSGTTGTALPTGWAFFETGTGANTSYGIGSGTSNSGNTYSFGIGSSSERAFGSLQSGAVVPTLGAAFVNDTSFTISALQISYVGEQWRCGATGRTDRIDFQYSLDATSLSTGTWIDVNALDFSSLSTTAVGEKDGNAPAFQSNPNAPITGLAIPNGAVFWIRWTSFDASGADDGLAVDTFSLTALAGDEPPTVVSTYPLNGAIDVATGDNLIVTFGEAVSVQPEWVGVTCDISGDHDVVITGGPTTFTLDPVTPFEPNEQCAVLVLGESVVDQDGTPDVMVDDHVFSFTTRAPTCGTTATRIHAVQGSGAASPMAGSNVTIEGVVVGDFQGSAGLSGFFVQEEATDEDPNPATSEGIFVFQGASGPDVQVGDVVRVTGTVTEYFDLTEISPVSSLEVCSAGASITPTNVTLPVATTTTLERYEGMLVSFPQELVASETYNLGRYGEVLLSVGERLAQPTNVVEPGPPAITQAEQNVLSAVQLDDGSNVQNPSVVPFLAADNTLRVGDTITGLTGVLSYSFSAYEVHNPTATFTRANPRPAPPAKGPGSLRIAGFNVLNYFTTLDTGAPVCGPSGGMDCRGANTTSEFTRQRTKILAALIAIDADVFGLNELENNASQAIADLVNGLNAFFGPGTYAYIDTGVIGTDAIKVGIIYKPANVTPVGAYALLTQAVDPNFIDTLNRPVLAQSFRQNATGELVTIAVNHLKSKGSACPGDPDIGDGQGNCNLTRVAAANAEAQWLASDPTGSGDDDVLVIGDLNSYAFEDPIAAFESAGYTNLIKALLGQDAYSYVFEGRSGYLDHALASSTLAPKVTNVVEWHINADEPRVLDYNQEFNPAYLYQGNAFRAADHDPVVVDIGAPVPVPLPPSGRWWTTCGLLLIGALLSSTARRRPSV